MGVYDKNYHNFSLWQLLELRYWLNPNICRHHHFVRGIYFIGIHLG